MNFIRNKTIERIISHTERAGSDISLRNSIQDGKFKITGVRKKTCRYGAAPIVESMQKSDAPPGVCWELLKDQTIAELLRMLDCQRQNEG